MWTVSRVAGIEPTVTGCASDPSFPNKPAQDEMSMYPDSQLPRHRGISKREYRWSEVSHRSAAPT